MITPLPDPPAIDTSRSRALTAALVGATLAYAGAGVLAMLLFAPRVPYADQWRHYEHLLTMRFPHNVFEVDGGHVEVLPHLLRLADLHFFGASELLQIIAGALLALTAAALLAHTIWRDRTLSRPIRVACMFGAVLGVFWLGNLRALTQSGDSVHVYLVLTCLAAATRVLSRGAAPAHPSRDVLAASLWCTLATFTFGTGVASFAAILALLFVRRSAPRQWLLVLLAGIATLLAYFALGGAGGAHALDPFDAALTGLRLLGAPFVYLFWPLLDPTAAAASPAPLQGTLLAIANAWTGQFGDIRRAVFPQAAIGALAVALALAFGLRLRRAPPYAAPAACLGFALTCFGIAIAALIAVARQAYFADYEDQIIAPRYLPWSSLCWAGLLITALARMRAPRRVTFVALAVALLALPSEIGMGALARRVREVAEDAALYAAVGVAPDSVSLGEATRVEDLRPALQALRSVRAAVFAWPESALLGEKLPADLSPLVASSVTAEPIVNRFDGDGTRILARFALAPCAARVLVASGGRAVGLLRRSSEGAWRGVAHGAVSDADISFYAVCR
jgi:hypothetical protein